MTRRNPCGKAWAKTTVSYEAGSRSIDDLGEQRDEVLMTHRVLVFYGSYRLDRMGIRLAHFIVGQLQARGDAAELIDAKRVGLPMLDRM